MKIIRHNFHYIYFRYYPTSQIIEVFRENDQIIVFSQLKATVTGKVQLHHDKDYKNFKVFLNPLQSSNKKSISVDLTGMCVYTYNLKRFISKPKTIINIHFE